MNQHKLYWYLECQEIIPPLYGDPGEAAHDAISDFLLDREINRRIQRSKLIAGAFIANKLAKTAFGITKHSSKMRSRPIVAAGIRLGGKGLLRVVPYVGTALMINDGINIARYAWDYFDD